jgi:hypothetical protein
MPPVIAALIPVFVAIGASSGVGTPITPDLLVPQDPPAPDGDTLAIYGRAFIFGEVSTHLHRPDGTPIEEARVKIIREGAEEFVKKMEGISILAPDLKTEIGKVTRTWIQAEGKDESTMFEGIIRDSAAARKALTWWNCGACLEFKYKDAGNVGPGLYEGSPANLRICLPDQSGFTSSYVYADDLPRHNWKVPMPTSTAQMLGGW